MTRLIIFLISLIALVSFNARADQIDITRLPLGDGKLSSSPRQGWIWPCRIDPNAGGAFRDGPWIDKQKGTYDLSAKETVEGHVTWPHRFSVRTEGDQRIFESNDLPNHATGIFPIAQNDKAFQYDRNPNSIHSQAIRIALPANPALASTPSCVPGAVGILLSGSVLFSALDAPGRDAVAHETQDACQGHPQISGVYHYHNISTCVEKEASTQDAKHHSALVGYALDGFGIYGRHGENGKILTSADLDECHGHTHVIPWDGREKQMYHYHATWDFPYSIGCMRGSFNIADMRAISGMPEREGRPGGAPPRK